MFKPLKFDVLKNKLCGVVVAIFDYGSNFALLHKKCF
jgi:hypothetical protein